MFLTDFEHEDFKSSFKNYFKSETFHSYQEFDGLKVWVKNTYLQENGVKTILDVPDFVRVECAIEEPEIKGDNCKKYLIPAQSIKPLLFNITIEEIPPKQEHKFCLITERLERWMWFRNREKTCIDVTIN